RAFGIALLHVGGTGVKKDPDIAALLFEKAARTGHAFANYNLALSFLSGRGKPENPRRAALHLAYAAKQNIARAQYDLATLYDTAMAWTQTLTKPRSGFGGRLITG
ncbi:MAG: hypothetical protein AAFR01_09195, partial [Pseudomonadota bacterium]